jgi:hypothetical protein
LEQCCKFCGTDFASLDERADFCSPDCKTAFANALHVSRQLRYKERQLRLDRICDSAYARILAVNAVRSGSTRNFSVWIHRNISETMSKKEIEKLIKRLSK